LVNLSIADGNLVLHARGADKPWFFKRSLEIPLVQIASVRADPEAALGWYHGIRMPGTNVPGVITAGTFYQDGKRVFWDVHDPEKTIVIDLHDERFNQLVIEVADHGAAVKLIQSALGSGFPPIHKDPFDRVLIAPATVEGLALLTTDFLVAKYPGPIRTV
jgi:hypothetical protein